MIHDDGDASYQGFFRQARFIDDQIRQRSTVLCSMNEFAQRTSSRAFRRRPAPTSLLYSCKLLVGSKR